MGVKHLIRYIGGKTHMARNIISLLDYSKSIYVELFFGSGAVFFNKRPHKVEVINDLNKYVFNFFLVLKNKKEELLEKLKYLYLSEDIFYYYRDNEFNSDIENAIKFFVLSNMSFGGNMKTFGAPFENNSLINKVHVLEIYNKRLQNAIILNRDYSKILDKVKNKDCCIYADPPYFGTEQYYEPFFGKDEHVRLSNMLNECVDNGSQVLVSYYYFDGIEELYSKSKFDYYEFECIKSAGINRSKSIELVIVSKNTNKKFLF